MPSESRDTPAVPAGARARACVRGGCSLRAARWWVLAWWWVGRRWRCCGARCSGLQNKTKAGNNHTKHQKRGGPGGEEGVRRLKQSRTDIVVVLSSLMMAQVLTGAAYRINYVLRTSTKKKSNMQQQQQRHG